MNSGICWLILTLALASHSRLTSSTTIKKMSISADYWDTTTTSSSFPTSSVPNPGKTLRVSGVSLQVKECDDCNMSIFGDVSVKICGKGRVTCCETGNLNHAMGDDFEAGNNFFDKDLLGDCNMFDMGTEEDFMFQDLSKVLTVYHHGPDAVEFEFGAVHLDNEFFVKCELHGKLDNSQFTTGQNCRYL